jgi:hypothetical protein
MQNPGWSKTRHQYIRCAVSMMRAGKPVILFLGQVAALNAWLTEVWLVVPPNILQSTPSSLHLTSE